MEIVPDTNKFLNEYGENEISFLAHMGVWKDKPSSTLRVVLLSNLSQDGKSHNHCIESGVNLCDNILKNILYSRFGRFLVITDFKGSEPICSNRAIFAFSFLILDVYVYDSSYDNAYSEICQY